MDDVVPGLRDVVPGFRDVVPGSRDRDMVPGSFLFGNI